MRLIFAFFIYILCFSISFADKNDTVEITQNEALESTQTINNPEPNSVNSLLPSTNNLPENRNLAPTKPLAPQDDTDPATGTDYSTSSYPDSSSAMDTVQTQSIGTSGDYHPQSHPLPLSNLPEADSDKSDDENF